MITAKSTKMVSERYAKTVPITFNTSLKLVAKLILIKLVIKIVRLCSKPKRKKEFHNMPCFSLSIIFDTLSHFLKQNLRRARNPVKNIRQTNNDKDMKLFSK